MAQIPPEELEQLVGQYKAKLKSKLQMELELPGEAEAAPVGPAISREYKEFVEENKPARIGFYEKLCSFSENLLRIKPGKAREAELLEAINTSHISITPSGAASAAIVLPLSVAFTGAFISVLVLDSMFFALTFLIVGLTMMFMMNKIPDTLAVSWRMKASNQMVMCIFYVVTYMRHTSNLENAINFAAEHLTPPMSLDLKRVLWNVETQKYESIKESLDLYLETWRKYNMEFVEAFHLIESSLYEPQEARRLELLDKSLDVILTETYEKMLHYAQNLKSPIQSLNMLGVILPVLGLVILPMVVSFMGGVQWYHLAVMYNIFLPVAVYFMGKKILSTRPSGYGASDISEENPELKKFRNHIVKVGGQEIQISPKLIAVSIFAVLLLLGISPIIMHIINFPDMTFGKFLLLDYHPNPKMNNEIVGPFGFGSSLISMFIPLAFGLSLGIYFKLRSQNVIKIREKSKQLEDEFSNALFQLGNRLGDGIPAELSFDKVASVMPNTASGHFFEMVSMNIKKLGMGVEEAIFNPQSGALIYFPSNVIESSMKVLVQSIRKGPQVAAQALVNVSRYIKEMHKVNERLQDLMSEVISSIKSQISFLTPVISGIVIGITSMISTILGSLGKKMGEAAAMGSAGSMNAIMDMFGEGVPTYYFQIVVGVYVVQLVYILTILANTIENGDDKLNERYALGQNLVKSTMTYVIIATAVMIVFNMIAASIL